MLKKHAVRTIAALMVASAGLAVSGEPAHGSVWDDVAACESGGNWGTSTGNGFHGGLQFTSSTWLAYGGGQYASTAAGASRAAQISVAQRVLAGQGPGAWPTCGARAGLSRSNGGASETVSRSSTRHVVRHTSDLVVDGILGPLTARALQRRVGSYQDGIVGPKTIGALQRKLHVRRTGKMNAITVRKLQVVLHIRRDGSRTLNQRTVAALQRYLNRR